MTIQQFAPELERLLAPDQEVEELCTGFGVAEGPLWYAPDRHVLFSDLRNNRTMRWAASTGAVDVFRENTNQASGLAWDPQGRLISCEGGARRVTRLEPDGSLTVVAERYQGTPINRPNDVVVKSDGSIYFTDPARRDAAGNPDMDLPYCGVYRVSPDLMKMTLIAGDLVLPNGLCFSPDETILYINDSMGVLRHTENFRQSIGHTLAYHVQPDGTLANKRVLFEMRWTDSPGLPDGIKADTEGNLYCAGAGGVWVVDPSGKHLGTILTGEDQTTNCAWGGVHWHSLFITTRQSLLRIRTNVAGAPGPSSPQSQG